MAPNGNVFTFAKSARFFVDQFRDKTERFMQAAKQRAIDAIQDAAPKLTSLERGYWIAEKRRRQREEDIRKAAS